MEALQTNFLRGDIFAQYWPMIAQGMLVTLELAAAIIVSGLALGLILALLRLAKNRLFNMALRAYVDVCRSLPPLVTIVLLFFGLQTLGLQLTGFVAVWLALAVTLSAYAEEVFHSSLLSISRGQVEAALSSGMTFPMAVRHIVLPQALKRSIAPLTNRTIAITKSTSLASVVAVPEILGQATSIQSLTYNTTPLTMAAVAYVILFFPLVLASRAVEARFGEKG